MDPLDVMQSFVEHCERSTPASELTVIFQRTLEHLGFRHFACCSHVNPRNPPRGAVVLHNYPSPWVRSYADRDLHRCDPVFRRAERDILPFRWNTPDFRAGLTLLQKRMLREAASIGIADGYTVPIHLPWAAGSLRASCSVIPDSSSIDDRSYRAVQVMATYLYATVARHQGSTAAHGRGPGSLLSTRECQCLELAAQGKSDWDISQLLGISEHTVHKHVEAAKRRLGVSTRIQAIVWAVQHRAICFGDVVNSIETESSAVSMNFPSRPTSLIRKPPMH